MIYYPITKKPILQHFVVLILLCFSHQCLAISFDSLPILELRGDENSLDIPDDKVVVLDIEKFDDINRNETFEKVAYPFSKWKEESEYPETFDVTIAFRLKNKSIRGKEWLINIPGNYSEVRLIRDDGRFKDFKSGTLCSYSDRAVDYGLMRVVYYSLDLAPNEEVTVLAHMDQSHYFPFGVFNLELHSPLYAEHLESTDRDHFFDGAFNAVAILLTLYCLFIYFSTRQPYYLWQALHSLAIIFYLFGLIGGFYRLGLDPTLIIYFVLALFAIPIAVKNYFLRHYFQLNRNSPIWDRILRFENIFLLGFSILILIFFKTTHHCIYALRFCFGILFINQLISILFAWFLLKWKESYAKILAVGTLIVFPIFIISFGFSFQNVLNGYIIARIASSLYLWSVVLSFGQRTALDFKNKLEDDKLVIRNQVKLEEMEKMSELKSHLFTNVSHELRTPLSLIIGPIKTVLNTENLAEKSRKLLLTAQSNSQHLLKMVSSILDLSKYEAGKLESENEDVRIHEFCERSTIGLAQEAHIRGIFFKTENTLSPDISISIDPEKLKSIIENLLSNALKYSRKGDNVIFKSGIEKNDLILKVQDTGKGIHPDDIDFVFDRYYQSNRSDVIIEGGSGIGLALCKEYVKMMGGDIKVSSSLGVGTMFSVVIPVETFQENHRPTNIETVHPKKNADVHLYKTASVSSDIDNRQLILIVEDNYDLQDYLKQIVVEKYQVKCVNNGQEALRVLGWRQEANNGTSLDNSNETISPDLIITDLMMPEMGGFSLITELKKSTTWSAIPVIILTAKTGTNSKIKALRMGIDDYMVKPFDNDELLIRIKNLLGNLEVRRSMDEDVIEGGKKEDLGSEPLEIKHNAIERLWLEELEHHILDNIGKPNFDAKSLSQSFALSTKQLSRRLKKLVGLTAHKYIQEIRLNKAKEILESETADSVKSVSLSVGFKKGDYFSKIYFERFGKRPSEYLSE